MPFDTDYSDIPEGSNLIPEGEYECIIKYAGEDATQGGTVYFGATLVLRNDVDQKYKNKYLFHKIWHKKEPSPADLACGGYSSKQINSLAKAAGLPAKHYESLEDLADELQNKPVRVTVEHDTYNGKTREKVKWVNESKHLPCNHKWKDEADVSADDLPDDQNYAQPAIIPQPNEDFQEVSGISDDDLPF
ncbi:MAG TPA: DUF669 domain-containing protein [Oscillospiraceae bacterium]|nr:DUF669 domain-containing protein [Oscillospiraceae bacterium]